MPSIMPGRRFERDPTTDFVRQVPAGMPDAIKKAKAKGAAAGKPPPKRQVSRRDAPPKGVATCFAFKIPPGTTPNDAVASLLTILRLAQISREPPPRERAQIASLLSVREDHTIKVLETAFLHLYYLDFVERGKSPKPEERRKVARLKNEWREGVAKLDTIRKQMAEIPSMAGVTIDEAFQDTLLRAGLMTARGVTGLLGMERVLQALSSCFPEHRGRPRERLTSSFTYMIGLAWRATRGHSPNQDTSPVWQSSQSRRSGEFPEFVRKCFTAMRVEPPGDGVLENVLSLFPRDKWRRGKNARSDERLDEDWRRACAAAEAMNVAATRLQLLPLSPTSPSSKKGTIR